MRQKYFYLTALGAYIQTWLVEWKREPNSNLAGSIKPLLSSSSSSSPFYPHLFTALLCCSSPSLCAPSTFRSKSIWRQEHHRRPRLWVSAPSRPCSPTPTASPRLEEEEVVPRVCLFWSFLLANWTSDLSPAFLIRLGFLFSLSYVLSVSVSLCAFASSGFPFPSKKNKNKLGF